MYSIAHPFGADEAAEHARIRAFYEGSEESGLPVAVEFTAENFFIREPGVLSVGEATTGVWDLDNAIGVANETVKHTRLVVQPWDLQTTPQANDRSGPTPPALAKIVESNNLMPNIKRWSKQNAPNGAWAVAAASMTADMDAGTGSGSGGGTSESRFKEIKEENAKLRREMGLISTGRLRNLRRSHSACVTFLQCYGFMYGGHEIVLFLISLHYKIGPMSSNYL